MRGKLILALIIASVVIISIILMITTDYDSFWKIWKVHVMSSNFGDLRNLTGGAESIAAGYDPLHENPGDPWERNMNHPRLVQYIVSALGFNKDLTIFIGITFAALFFLSLFIFCKPFDKATALSMSIIIFSPPVMLGLERGNHDLFIFFLVCSALAVSSISIATLLLTISAFIKLFPVFAIGYFLKCGKKDFLLWTSAFVTTFLIYLYLNRVDLIHIFEGTRKGFGLMSYGSRSFAHITLMQSLIPSLAITISVLIVHLNKVRAGDPIEIKADYIDAFRIGAGIYIGTFFLGNNWDYRQMFFILTIPQLVAWKKEKHLGVLSKLTLFIIIATCWFNILPRSLVFTWLEEILEWVLLANLLHLFIGTIPVWMQKAVFQFSLANQTKSN